MAKRASKAIAGGFSAGVAAALTGFAYTGAPTRDQVSKMIGSFVVGFAFGAYAVYKAPANAPALP